MKWYDRNCKILITALPHSFCYKKIFENGFETDNYAWMNG